MSMTATKNATPPAAPVLLGLRELAAVFPKVAENTIYRWNTERNGQKQLPEPYRTISGTPMWTEDQISQFADRKNLTVDADAIEIIRKSQHR